MWEKKISKPFLLQKRNESNIQLQERKQENTLGHLEALNDSFEQYILVSQEKALYDLT